MKSAKEEMEQNCAELRKQIKSEFQGSSDELRRTLHEFQEKVEDMKENLVKVLHSQCSHVYQVFNRL